MGDLPSLSTFTPHVGATFRLHVDSHSAVDAELVSAKALAGAPVIGSRQPFVLVFKGPAGAPRLPQRIYGVEHDAVPRQDIFIVPIGTDGDRLIYEAIFT